MTDHISAQLAEAVYRKAEQLADHYNQPVIGILAEAFALAQKRASDFEQAQQMSQERAAYREMHDRLMADYESQYVAIHGGVLVDHDREKDALVSRVGERFPDKVVLLTQVRPLPHPRKRSLS